MRRNNKYSEPDLFTILFEQGAGTVIISDPVEVPNVFIDWIHYESYRLHTSYISDSDIGLDNKNRKKDYTLFVNPLKNHPVRINGYFKLN